MKIGTLTVTGAKFRLPCVYELIRRDTVLYVGYSARGFSRAFYRANSKSDADKRAQAFDACDDIRITVFDNISEAAREEVRLIKLLKPWGNTAHKGVIPNEYNPIPKKPSTEIRQLVSRLRK